MAALSALKPCPQSLNTAFRVAEDVSQKYFDLEVHSPDLMVLGDTCPTGNPLKSKAFKTDDYRWKFVLASARHTLRLFAYSTALSDLLCRVDKLNI